MSLILSAPWTAAGVLGLLIVVVVAIYDVFVQKRHTILHNFPVVGHFRYLLELVGPELRQYWVANDKEELPFNRSERGWIYASAKGENNASGFGTSEQIYSVGYPILKHAAFPCAEKAFAGTDPSYLPCLRVIGAAHGRRRPYRPQSVVNVSAMSFGALGERAVRAINAGVAQASAYQNTGEGGLAPHHLGGGEGMWQIGTGYFGARGPDGRFDLGMFAEKCARWPQVRAIEVKLSQGAKPGKGGILPGRKVTAEIAAIRGIPVGKDCYSPAHHTEFQDVDGLIDFVERLADRTGLPVGIKSAIGQLSFWQELATRMRVRGAGPDFISIDGGEGGTGAAPLHFADHVSLPFKVGFKRVYPLFQAEGLAHDVAWIGSGKLGFPDRAAVAMAMGCDLIHVAREAMIAIGCIQAQKCHTDHCPAGVATQNQWLQSGVNVEDKAQRLGRYIQVFRKELLELAHATGHPHPGLFRGEDIEFSTGVNEFSSLTRVTGYEKDVEPLGPRESYGPTA